MWRARQHQKGLLLLQTLRPRGGCLHELPSSGSQACLCISESGGRRIAWDHASGMAGHFTSAAVGALVRGPSIAPPSLESAAATLRSCHAPSTRVGADGARCHARRNSLSGISRDPTAIPGPALAGSGAKLLLHTTPSQGEQNTRAVEPRNPLMGAQPALVGHSLLPAVPQSVWGRHRVETPVRSMHNRSQPQAQSGACALPVDGTAWECDRETGRRLMHSSTAAPEPVPAGRTGLGSAKEGQGGGDGAWGKHLLNLPQSQDVDLAAVHPQLVALLEHLPFALLQQPRAVTHAAAHVASAHAVLSQRGQGRESVAGPPVLDAQALPGMVQELASLLLVNPEKGAPIARPGGGWSLLARAAAQMQGSDAGPCGAAWGGGRAQAGANAPGFAVSPGDLPAGFREGQAQESRLMGLGRQGPDSKGRGVRSHMAPAPAAPTSPALPGGSGRKGQLGQGRGLGSVARAVELQEEETHGFPVGDAPERVPAEGLALPAAGGRVQLKEASCPPLRDGRGGAQAVAGLDEEEVAARLAEAQQELQVRRQRAGFDAAQERRQLAMEQCVREEAQGEHWKEALGLMQVGKGAEMGVGRELMDHWYERLCPELDRCRKAALEDERSMDHVAAKLLQDLPTSVLASITLQKTVEALLMQQSRALRQDTAVGRKRAHFHDKSKNGNSIYSLNIVTVLHLGKALELEVAYKDLKKAVRSSLKRRRGWLQRREAAGRSPGEGAVPGGDEELEMLTALMVQSGIAAWESQQQAEVGAFLLSALTRTADIPLKYLPAEEAERIRKQHRSISKKGSSLKESRIFVPAFSKDLIQARNDVRRFGVLCWNPLLADVVPQMIALRAPQLPYKPMVVPPRPWKGVDQGGYLTLPCSIMRTRAGTGKQQHEVLAEKSADELQLVFQALDVLGSTGWCINRDVARVMEALWEEGGGTAGLVDRADLPLPEEPPPGASDVEWKRHQREVKRTEKINSERHSLRADMTIKLQLLDEFRDEKCFFYPHNLDFRGRAYPVHAHLHHLGADHCRGVLQFAEGKPLGERGLWWLKAHLANVFAVGGVDKLPLPERVAFTEAHLERIMESADRPLDAGAWWRQGEDPFQCLAVCFELTKALRSPEPEAYVSHLPVHQDGSCNGLQHYAALGLDVDGARSVNLAASDSPSDVYREIAHLVRARVERDHGVHSALGGLASAERPVGEGRPGAGRGVPLNDLQYRRMVLGSSVLLGHVDRKLVKQTVMTSVYGVTTMGATDQIRSRIREKGLKVPKDLLAGEDEERVLKEVSGYAAKIVLDSLSEMFVSARHIMKWLATCAELVALQGHCVQWTTPLGLPVVQPYTRGDKFKHARTTFAQITLPEVYKTKRSQVDCARQKSAFPPNYVHSLDSTHMMRTALACNERGITFAGVHDSFWTHAASVDQMNKLLRQEFVSLYSEPILENLLEEFERTYPGIEFPELPRRGNFNLEEVLMSTYFFS